MNAAMLLIWLAGALVGSMLFFALAVAPTAFRALPRINRARERGIDGAGAGDATADRQFKRLHLQSVLINAAQLLLLIGISFVPD